MTQENVGLLRNGNGGLVRKDTRKAEAFNAFLTSVFTAKTSLQTGHAQGPDGMHAQKLRKQAHVVARSFLVFSERSWQSGDAPQDWKKANVTLIFKKGKTEDPGNHRPFSLSLIRQLNIRRNFTGRVVKHWHRLLREAMESPSFEILKIQPDNAQATCCR
ncbi:hypothetical protein QYF61_023888 [Mycteria americana]|uniref:Uncharacterized protein n=1 Tax=Mycteria americana TaxID=33587 RepID=A0AAN7MZQ3_MYCAM|nr:hypothetical protein QYF61_023888 [Mycteria americana]